MTPEAIIERAAAEGVSLALSPTGSIKASGNAEAVKRWLATIRAHKLGIATALASQPQQRQERAAELLRLVHRIADAHGFTAEERAEAARSALADQVAALECFRALLEELDRLPAIEKRGWQGTGLQLRRCSGNLPAALSRQTVP